MPVNGSILVQLEHLRAGAHDLLGVRIVIEPFPARAEIADAFFAGVAPDRADIVKLVEWVGVELIKVVTGGEHAGARITVESLPARAVIADARLAGVAP